MNHSLVNPGLFRWLMALIAIVLLAGCDVPAESPEPEAARPVRVAAIEAVAMESEIRLPATLRAVQRAEPAFLQSGYLAERRVSRGQVVQAGELLARLENPSLEPALEMAQSRLAEMEERLAQAERELRRGERLRESGAVSTEELDRLASQRDSLADARDQARAALQESQQQMESASLRAPFDARVMAVHAEPGDFLAAGQAVMNLAGIDGGLEIALSLPGHVADGARLSQSVSIQANRDGTTGQGQLVEIGLADASGLAPALVSVDDDAFYIGQAVQVRVGWQRNGSGSEQLLVPLTALSSIGSERVRLFRVNDGRAEAIDVVSGRISGGLVEVSANGDNALTVGDQVVVAGQINLAAGDRVRVLP